MRAEHAGLPQAELPPFAHSSTRKVLCWTSRLPLMKLSDNSPSPPATYCPIQNRRDLRDILFSSEPLDLLLQLDSPSASFVIELLYTELQAPGLEDGYRQRCLKYLKYMVKKYHTLPPSLFVNNIERDGRHALNGGGFADIYKGNSAGNTVCLKVLRVHTADSDPKREKIVSDFCQETLIWTQLRHPNLLPLLGVNTNLFPTGFCLVSPWMVNGDVISFLEKNPGYDKFQVVYEIACGLKYLHSLSPSIVHGDIKGANILVDEYFRCRLADFGLADAAAETTMIHATPSGVIKGSIRWMAPEMYAFTTGMNVENKPKQDRLPQDIYAFACTVLEIMTGKPPFHDLIDPAVMYQVSVCHIRPKRPLRGWCPDHIWNLVELCWHEDPATRPRAKALQSYLQNLLDVGNPFPGDPHFIGYFKPEHQFPSSSALSEGLSNSGPEPNERQAALAMATRLSRHPPKPQETHPVVNNHVPEGVSSSMASASTRSGPRHSPLDEDPSGQVPHKTGEQTHDTWHSFTPFLSYALLSSVESIWTSLRTPQAAISPSEPSQTIAGAAGTNHRNSLSDYARELGMKVEYTDFVNGPSESPTWKSTVFLNGDAYGTGVAGTKDLSREEAANAALIYFKNRHDQSQTYSAEGHPTRKNLSISVTYQDVPRKDLRESVILNIMNDHIDYLRYLTSRRRRRDSLRLPRILRYSLKQTIAPI
ncbi:hypothetical protein V5O48_010856 [Marasmius crinis-equi]|uniref:Protein kinase domain-containing protein n=1 Tax=Marasmius crinis-equi TaxID=585013 RepID=A0ABR3F7N9_9AGAR